MQISDLNGATFLPSRGSVVMGALLVVHVFWFLVRGGWGGWVGLF